MDFWLQKLKSTQQLWHILLTCIPKVEMLLGRLLGIIFLLIFLKILLAMVSSINYFCRASVNRFSDEVFEREFLRTIEPFFRQKQE